MKLSFQKSTLRAMKADAIVAFVTQNAGAIKRELSRYRTIFGRRLDHAVELLHFQAKEAEFVTLFTEGKLRSPRFFLVGLGEEGKLTLEQYRRAAAAAAKHAKTTGVRHISYLMPEDLGGCPLADVARAIAEGAYLSVYRFDKYLTDKNEHARKLTAITLIDPSEQRGKTVKRAVAEARIVCEATYLARDLENAPSNEIYPESLAERARQSAATHGYRAQIWDKRKIEQAGFGGLLTVNSGSTRPPRFIILEYNSGQRDVDTIVLIGKGITFDTGGISIKPSANMAEMKMDMSGAAAVIGTMEAAARLQIPIHLVGLVPSTENMPSGSAMKPGDIIVHYGGKTSEVDNTDAEGRLILADALAYAAQYKPNAVIDLATLTGACVVALGHHATGMMGNDDELMARLALAGEATYERVWPLPLYDEYQKQIKSDVADVKNVGGRWAGAITAGLFLKKFVDNYKWVHLDIAGTAMLEEDLPYTPKGGSGVGVRLLVEFLKKWGT
jgi:leucyl aminopeptidase